MKSNLEKEIKQQLENRLISPSDRAWTRISDSLDGEKRFGKTYKFLWIASSAAAAIALVFLLVLTKKTGTTSSIAKISDATSKAVNNQNTTTIPQFENKKSIPEKIVQAKTEKENSAQTKSVVSQNIPLIPDTVKPEIKIAQKEIQKELTVKTIAKTNDTIGKKNSNYVDPQMLLFSIEHDQAIKKKNAKKGTLVIVDFNKEK